MRKIKFLIVIILVIVITILVSGVFKKEKPKYTLAKVAQGIILQEVSESGTIKMGEEINLSFKNSGKIQQIYVKVGEELKAGQVLAKLDTTQLAIQLKESEAALEVAQSQLKKLLAGASSEEIQIAKTTVSNAEISLESARQNLIDVEDLAKENLKAAREDALNVLTDAYLKVQTSFEKVKVIQLAYFTGNDQEDLRVKGQKDIIENSANQINFYLEKAKASPREENIDLALSETKKSLEVIFQSLTIIRETAEIPPYRETVASADKTSLDTHKSDINTALTNVVNSQQTISLTKITNTSNINTAKNQVLAAEGVLKKAQDQLSQIISPARSEEVDLYTAKVKQAQAQVDLLKTHIAESKIISPTAGQITKIQKRIGETVQSTEAILSFISASPFQIEVDIYEEDIVKVKVGNPVDIKVTAFPEKKFKGKVISIEPAERLIEGVVYYKVTISFEELPEEAKVGMTADVVIITALKENVLIIPEDAIEEKNGKKIIQVLKDKTIEEREIKTGLKGSDNMIEVISGLKEEEEIILK